MVITFFGHSDYISTDRDEDKVLSILEETIGSNPVEFYLGGYGKFDCFVLKCCNKYKETHFNAKTIFVTPYLYTEYKKLKISEYYYDATIYPPIETVPKKFAISKRNEWMINQADYIISYITRHYGGAYTALLYAKRKTKPFINIFEGDYTLD